MRRPDRIGALIIALALFAVYLALANLLTFLGFPLPLGSVGNEVPLLAVVFANVLVIFLNSKKRQSR